MNKKPTKVYRFALYGLSASGKTCLLAALAMPRYPHALGYSCTWLPGSKQDAHSQEWIKKAVESLSRREVPEPNPTGEEHFTFEYDFTGADHQTFRIELVDYSGELVNPNISDSELAKSLRQKFAEMDGILVLGEAPYRDQLGHLSGHQKTRDAQTHQDLHDLRQTFSLLRGEKQEGAALDTPVVLLVNKWDRYSDIDSAHPDIEQGKLEDFFKSESPHKGLNDVLHHSVSEDNFKAFPVSALGAGEFVRLENGDVVERPKQVQPLNAFGLEDAFLWLAQRRDAIDLRDYQNNSIKNVKQCQQDGKALLNRFPPNSAQAKQVKSVLGQCKKRAFFYWAGTVAAVVLALCLVAKITMDSWNHENEEAFRQIAGSVKENWQKSDTLNELLEELRKLPVHQNAETDKMRQERVALEDTVLRHLAELASQRDWERFMAGYNDKMRRKNFIAAAQALQSRQSDERLEKLKAEFKSVVVHRIEEQVKRAFKDDRLREADEILKKYAQFPPELQQAPGREEYYIIKALQHQVAERQDQDLYGDIMKYMDREHTERYLDDAPLQTMKKEVSEYKTYLDKTAQTATIPNLKLFVRITWQTYEAVGDHNQIRVSLNGKNVISKNYVKSQLNQSTDIGTSRGFSAKASDRKTVEITVIEDDWLGDDDNGKGTVKKRISDLAKGYTLRLKSEGKTMAKAFIQIKGYPKAPNLLAWHDQK
ncbi:hypothetical protein PN36_08205 [Candidatus Thiomargarita nelsonii]|uniref:Uncharacterized protein n=1 Tax=Candidatus Thiomargarita nelsonii TaxID=1003181 RepID=A0A4E0QRL8_9GAMM|nr:hypothetical protein PN36_08205 [Candidatus Thiomargarita nelsonii]